jgi:hypothetical protein
MVTEGVRIQILTHGIHIRHGQQHSSPAPDGHEAWRALELTYPPGDRNTAWLQIRSAAAT